MNRTGYRKSHYAPVTEVTWPRLVLLDQSGSQLLSGFDCGMWLRDHKEWNIATLVDLVMNVLPWHGTLITAIDLPLEEFKAIDNNLDTFKGEIGRIVIYGDPFSGTSGDKHEIRVSAIGATIHVLAQEFFTSLRTDARTPWEFALQFIAESQAPTVSPHHFDTYFTAVGLAGPFKEVLLVRNVNPYLRSSTNLLDFAVTAYECRSA